MMNLRLLISLPCLLIAFSLAAQDAPKTNAAASSTAKLRDDWVDADTGHHVVRLSRIPGTSESFYFHQNAFTREGDKMVFDNRSADGNRIWVLDWATRKCEPLTDAGATGAFLSRTSRQLYYTRQGSAYRTHLDTHETKLIGRLPPRAGISTVNADDTLLAGTFVEAGAEPIDRSGPRSAWFDKTFEAKRPMYLYTLEIASGKTNAFFRREAWLNHLQFSPTDPSLLMFCHEGPWHKLDRIWTIRTDTNNAAARLMHERTMPMEIAGHEFWSHDGKTIWFDLQMPRGEKFFLAGVSLQSGKETRYALERDEWSVHFNISYDGKLFSGDGGASNMVAHAADGKWMRLFTPQPDGKLRSERLVNMGKHDYKLEPNGHFSPDGKWLVFRGNFDGSPQVYAVEIASGTASPQKKTNSL